VEEKCRTNRRNIPVPEIDCGEEIPHSPEQDLIIAVLGCVVKDLSSNIPDLVADAIAYLRRKDEEPFSFLWCCEAVNMDPDNFLRRLREWDI